MSGPRGEMLYSDCLFVPTFNSSQYRIPLPIHLIVSRLGVVHELRSHILMKDEIPLYLFI